MDYSFVHVNVQSVLCSCEMDLICARELQSVLCSLCETDLICALHYVRERAKYNFYFSIVWEFEMTKDETCG
jgi:hypothetical protein